MKSSLSGIALVSAIRVVPTSRWGHKSTVAESYGASESIRGKRESFDVGCQFRDGGATAFLFGAVCGCGGTGSESQRWLGSSWAYSLMS